MNSIDKRLSEAYRDATKQDFALEADRLVIFSDQHKGARDGADDFQRCERAYNAALAYYNHLDYQLVVLGDAEELWENSFEEIAASYSATLELEAAFHADGRYTRIWGNHDLVWTDTDLFRERMAPHGVGDVVPVEGLRLVVRKANDDIAGELFLVHGHQGTASSDTHARLSRFFVRHGWRRLQRLLDRPWNTPAVDWELRGEHARQMAQWAAEHRRVLISGHTHLPVFFGSSKEPVVPPVPPGGTGPVDEALRLARQRWAEAERLRVSLQQPTDLRTPCYFNTGCCSFGDGDITGIEIRDGSIGLVRWPCDPAIDREPLGEPLPLEKVFELTGWGQQVLE
jgi:predicted phosphodiesterase